MEDKNTNQTQETHPGRFELPAVVATPEGEGQHYSYMLIEDGIAQAADHLKTVEAGMAEINQSAQKLNERMQQLQARKISLQAQASLLQELKRKFEEFKNAESK
jgi:hypothetical protein